MKKRKNILAFLEDHFRENSSQSIEELTDYVAIYAEKPNVKKLIRSYYRTLTNRLIRKIRNEDGKRRVYADKGTKLYVDIESENDTEKLKHIRGTLGHQSAGNHEAYKRVTKRLAELNGQTVLQFESENPLTQTTKKAM